MSDRLVLHPDRLISTLEQCVPAVMSRIAIPGLAITLADHEAPVWSQGFGVSNMATGQPVTPDTIFEAGSLSKPVVAYAALKLCDMGILQLDRSLATYLPTVYLPDQPQLAHITLRHVLSHTTGFPNWRAEGQPLQTRFVPGTRFGYSGEGYVYLQYVIEHLTQQPFAAFMQTYALEPLEMARSSYIWRDIYATRAAHGHEADGSVIEKWQPETANAAYSLHTTARDFARFMSLAFNAKRTTVDSLSETLTNAMLTSQITVQGALAWGLGWGLHQADEHTSYWQWGDNTWFTGFAIGWPKQHISMVMLTNSVYGLQACQEIVYAAIGQDHPAFDWISAFYSTT